jgi:nicotinamidase-related amidase
MLNRDWPKCGGILRQGGCHGRGGEPLINVLTAIHSSQREQMKDLPDHYRSDHAGNWDYGPNPRAVFDIARLYRKSHRIAPAVDDEFTVEVVAVDMQKDFCLAEGSLYVAGRSGKGAIEDNDRIAKLIYRNLPHITAITPTLDTHYPIQIFFASFWLDESGEPVAPHTVISLESVEAGVFRPNPDVVGTLGLPDYDWLVNQCKHYCAELERAGKYQLYIWPEHCLIGGAGHMLVGVFQEARLFHAYARESQTEVEIKGSHPLTENYSVFNPEVLTRWDGKAPLVEKRTAFIDRLLTRDAIVFVGQAGSHCVRSSIDDFLGEIRVRDPRLAERCYVVTDCMSAVAVPDGRGGFTADFTPFMEEAFERFEASGIHLVESTTDMRDWPGMRL